MLAFMAIPSHSFHNSLPLIPLWRKAYPIPCPSEYPNRKQETQARAIRHTHPTLSPPSFEGLESEARNIRGCQDKLSLFPAPKPPRWSGFLTIPMVP